MDQKVYKQVSFKARVQLQPLLHKQASFYGQMISAQPVEGYPYQVLLRPAEVGGINVSHVWVNVPQLFNRLERNHVFPQEEEKGLDEVISFDGFYVLSGTARVDHYFKLIQGKGYCKENYGITLEKAKGLFINDQDGYVQSITDKVSLRIARRYHLSLRTARHDFLFSPAFDALSSTDSPVAGMGPKTFLNLYRQSLVSQDDKEVVLG